MTDKEFKAQEKRVLKFIEKHTPSMGINWYRMKYEWYRLPFSDSAPDVAADTYCNWQYRQATIRWCLPILMDLSDAELENVVVHEFCHVLLGPLFSILKNSVELSSEVKDINELTTEGIAKAILWSRDDAKKEKKG